MRPSWWTGSDKAALRRPRWPLATPEEAAWTCATASPALGSVWRHRCGRCRPRSGRFISPHPLERTSQIYPCGDVLTREKIVFVKTLVTCAGFSLFLPARCAGFPPGSRQGSRDLRFWRTITPPTNSKQHVVFSFGLTKQRTVIDFSTPDLE